VIESSEVIESIEAFLHSVMPVSSINQQLMHRLINLLEQEDYPRGTILLKDGEVCRYLFIVQKGFLRRYTFIDGRDVTREFARENEMITSMYSINTHQASMDFIETLEDCRILKLKIKDLESLYIDSKESLFTGKLLREKYFLNLEKRTLSLQVSSAKERYENLIRKQPDILQRATLGQIATYLGMTQETLSRLRRKR
jgi:CRP-like cAMP-binding protein